MEQFVIKPIIPIKIGDIDISFTNSALFMVLAVVVSTLLLGFCIRKEQLSLQWRNPSPKQFTNSSTA